MSSDDIDVTWHHYCDYPFIVGPIQTLYIFSYMYFYSLISKIHGKIDRRTDDALTIGQTDSRTGWRTDNEWVNVTETL